MRQFAFDENEARDFVQHSAKKIKVKIVGEIKTFDEQIKVYRDFIEEI
jgi:hypothetical protein